MCWNAQVSIISFFIISSVSWGLYQRNLNNDRLLAVFIMSYGIMQLFETFMWLGQSKKWHILNIIGSVLACLLLYLHPLAIIIGIKLDKLYKSIINTLKYKILAFLSILLMIFGLYRIIYELFFNNIYSFLAYPDKLTKHLIWDFPTKYNYTLILTFFITFLIIAQFSKPLFIIILFIYYFAPAIYILFNDGNNFNTLIKLLNGTFEKKNTYYGSYWCWIVAFFSFIMYLINPYFQ